MEEKPRHLSNKGKSDKPDDESSEDETADNRAALHDYLRNIPRTAFQKSAKKVDNPEEEKGQMRDESSGSRMPR